jgi:predicted RNase H-like HicB family nuclease
MAETLRLPLRIVFYKDEADWIAHCLEFDLIGDGSTRQEAMERLVEAIVLQIQASVENENTANLFTPADGKYLRMFAAGKDVAKAELRFREIHAANVEIDQAEYREYLGAEPVGAIG